MGMNGMVLGWKLYFSILICVRKCTLMDAFAVFMIGKPTFLGQLTSGRCSGGLIHRVILLTFSLPRWLIHPRTDPSQSVPLVRRYRSNSGLGYPFLVPQLSREHRNNSISSSSSQSSSQGGSTTPSSLDSPVTPQSSSFDQAPAFAVVDSTSGAIIPAERAHLLAASQPNSNGRYQTFLYITDARGHSPQSPRSPLARPRPLQYPTEQRGIMIRELNVHATEQGLRELFAQRNVPTPIGLCDIRRPDRNRRCHALVTFSTAADAREAVRRLNRFRFMDRTLEVTLAQDGTTVPNGQRPIIADGSV